MILDRDAPFSPHSQLVPLLLTSTLEIIFPGLQESSPSGLLTPLVWSCVVWTVLHTHLIASHFELLLLLLSLLGMSPSFPPSLPAPDMLARGSLQDSPTRAFKKGFQEEVPLTTSPRLHAVHCFPVCLLPLDSSPGCSRWETPG